jgi:hypothetical protein
MLLVRKIIIVVVGALALLPVASATSSQKSARIVITDLKPFTVSGSGFASHERVKVTVVAKKHVARAVVASATGAFTARLATVHIDRCTAYMVRAVGNDGHAVTRRVVPECAPAGAAADGGTITTTDGDVLYPIDPQPKRP